MPLSREHGRLRAAHPGVRDAQTASVLGALSPTARRILKAAFRVLERDGYEGLTLRRIAAEAGETRSLIAYHFENKAGLVTTLVDSLWHDADVALEQEVEGLAADARGRLLALTGLHLRLAQQPGLYRTYFDLLPNILRDDEARSRLARTYRSYRRIGELCLAPGVKDKADPQALATLLLAIGEGVSVQTLLGGDDALAAGVFALLERRVAALLDLGPLVEVAGEVLAADVVAAQASSPGASPGGATAARKAGAVAPSESLATIEALEDPAATLTPAAARVLRAALALLYDEGAQSLTADAIARASGEPTSSVFYHFGDKHGLIAVVLRASDYRFAQALLKAARRVMPRSSATEAVVDVLVKIYRQPGWMRALYDVLPVALRDEELCRQEAEFVALVRASMVVYLLEAGMPEVEAGDLAAMCLALTHGLAVQRLVDPRGTPVSSVLETLRVLLRLGGEGPSRSSNRA